MQPSSRRPARHAGFTLVELLVAVALGLLVMVALIAVYLNISRTNSEMYKTNALIENGRFAVDVLNEDVSMAGFWDGYVPRFDNYSLRVTPDDVPTAAALALGPCAAYATWTAAYRAMLVGTPVEVFGDGTPTGCDTTTLIKDRLAGTDVLVVRHAEGCIPSDLPGGSPNCEAFNAAKVYFQKSSCATQISAGAFPLAANASSPYQLGVSSTYPLTARNCTTASAVRKFISNIYYVRSWANTAGDGIPTLVRTSFNLNSGLPAHEAPAQALIEGIEVFRVELGLDTGTRSVCLTAPNTTDYTTALASGAGGNIVDPASCTYNAVTVTKNTLPRVRGDGVPDSYTRCPATGCTAGQLVNAVAVKLYVLARSKDKSPLYTDPKSYAMGSAGTYTPTETGYKRHLFQTTVRLVNVGGRRETPTP